MRVAWLGPAPTDNAGVSYAAGQLLKALSRQGVSLDCFVAAPEHELPAALRGEPELRFFCGAPRWEWDRWYSRTPLMKFATGQAARGIAQARLARLIAERHAHQPYDLFYQFSQPELLWVRRLRRRFPPIVLHPQVHAAGERHWHRREAHLARTSEPRLWNFGVGVMLTARAWQQRRDSGLARLVIAPSAKFAAHLARDYAIPAERLSVVPNPIDLDRFSPRRRSSPHSKPLVLLFVSRLAVRKGVELVVGLSHRLADLAGQVRIEIIGDASLWSDYRRLLEGLDGRIAAYSGPIPGQELPDHYRRADALLQPSHYEPFGLTVAEALASGLPVVASDEVGAAEEVDRRCCLTFRTGDLHGLEAAVRTLISLDQADRTRLGKLARDEAERLFSGERVGARLAQSLELAMTTTTDEHRTVAA